MDRQEMATTLMAGLTTVAHSYMSPTEPEFKEFMKRSNELRERHEKSDRWKVLRKIVAMRTP